MAARQVIVVAKRIAPRPGADGEPEIAACDGGGAVRRTQRTGLILQMKPA
jgi:hypothetical protein